MKYISILLFILFPVFAWATNKPEYAVTNIATELMEGAEAVIREDFVDFKVSSIKNAEQRTHFVVTRLEEGAPFEKLTIHYNMHSQIGKITAMIYDEDGMLIRKIGKKEILDYSAVDGGTMYSDSRVKYIDFSYGNYPYTIEYEYEKTYNGLRTYPGWHLMGYKTAVEKSGYILTIPANLEVNYRVFNLDTTPEISTVGSQKNYTWNAKNLSAIESESYSPMTSEILPMVLFAPQQFSIDGYVGSLESWDSFGKFMHELNRERGILSSEMKAEVKKLTANASTEVEKIDILYRYIQDNMRYVSVQLGIGGWQTFDAAYVEKNKFGDCKALTYFLRSLLEEVGITAYPALVNAGRSKNGETYADFPYPLFNHVILNIPSVDYWLECTSADNPPNYLGTFTDDRNVLLITEKGGIFSKTPTIPIENNLAYNKATINLDSKGAANISSQSTFTGTQQEYYRSLEKNQSKEDIKKYFSRIVNLPTFNLKDYSLSSSLDEPKVEFTYEVDLPRYGSKAGKRLFMPLNLINPMTDIPSKMEDRKFDIRIKRGYVEQGEFKYILPNGTTIESIPEKTASIVSEFGMYEMSIEQEKNIITYKRTLKIFALTAAAERYDEWRDFYKEVAKMDKMKVVLIQQKS